MSDGAGSQPPDTEPPRVAVSNRQGLPVDERGLSDLVHRTLAGEGHPDAEVVLSFVTAAEMSDLHVRFVGEPGPTDVLAFPMDDEGLLGDVVVCPEVAGRNNPDADAELRLLVVHGTLHLLGFDHEDDEERGVMWERQAAYSGVRL